VGGRSHVGCSQVAYSSDLGRLLRISSVRCGEGPGQRGQQEAATVHYSIT
jgi:hypothetical protein